MTHTTTQDSYAVVKGGDGAIPIKLVAKFTGDDKESASSSSLLLLQNQLLLHLKLQRKLQSTATVLLPFTPLTVHYLPPSL